VSVAADALLTLGLLRSVAPCRFEHPILRSAVDSEIAPAQRGRLHLLAARVLASAEMPVDAIVAHLMQTPPLGEPWIAAALRHAAAQAGARGAPAGAVAYLQRALAERPAARERRALLLELGRAQSQIHSSQAPHHLQEALALAQTPDEFATVALWLGQALYHSGALDEAYEVLSDVVDRGAGQGGDATLELEAYLLSIAAVAGKMPQIAGRAASLEARTPPGSPVAGAVQATLALRETFGGEPRDRVRARVGRALVDIQGGSVASSAGGPTGARPGAGMDRRARPCRRAVHQAADGRGEDGQAAGVRDLLGAAWPHAAALWRPRGRGGRRRARRGARGAGRKLGLTGFMALIVDVRLLVEAGRAGVAEARGRGARLPAGFERGFMTAMLRHAVGAAQLAQGKLDEARATFTAVGELCDATGLRSPAIFPWRSDLALTLAGTDRHAEGVQLAATELRMADRCDIDRARGYALRALGLLRGGETGLRDLHSAVQTFERSPARLELGWASYELGAALRRAKRRRDARAPLNRALDLALACGSQLLAQRAGQQLQALGARPRSVMRSGAESLTPSELRVCQMAAEGLKEHRDRPSAVRLAEDRRDAPAQLLSQARHRVAGRAASSARRATGVSRSPGQPDLNGGGRAAH
jgi:tetratricopeptide (TPR) repeat protein